MAKTGRDDGMPGLGYWHPEAQPDVQPEGKCDINGRGIVKKSGGDKISAAAGPRTLDDWSDVEKVQMQATAHRRLNIGGGNYPLAYFTNIDEDPGVKADLHVRVPPLPYPDCSMEQIWACHFLEHLERPQAHELVQECWRVLEPGGGLGLVVPDGDEILRRYLAGAIDQCEYPPDMWWPVADLDAVCALFIYSTVQQSPHRWLYSLATLRRFVEAQGFMFVREVDRFADTRLGSGCWWQVGCDWIKPN